MFFTKQVIHLEYLLFWIKSQSSVAYKSVICKRAFNVVLRLLKMKKQLCHVSLFLCLSGISLEQSCRRSLVKSERFGKNIKSADGH